MPNRLGIIAGGGSLPAKLIARCREIGRDVFVLAFEGQTDPAILAGVAYAWTRLGAADSAIQTLKQAGVSELVIVGAMRRPSTAELRPDWRVAKFMARVGLRALGDDGLLKAVKAELEGEGFTLVGVDQVLSGLVATDGIYGQHRPDAQAEADIAHGFHVLAGIGALDIGQAVVVQQGLVLGVEAIEGTDNLLARSAGLKRDGPGGVLVKASKPGQERRLDLPTIGPGTVEAVAAAGLRGIAVEAGSTLVVDRSSIVEAADRLGLFVLGQRSAAETPLFYLIAGEPSGDVLGARLMAALRARLGGAVRFAGIGGREMEAAGLVSRLPIRDLALMGFIELIPTARRILRQIRETAEDIRRQRPTAVVTIDSSGFCFRVADQLRRKPNPPLIIHYVAPMVWVWRAHRAKTAAHAADHLLTLLPFEPEHFVDVGLKATYVGHPVVEGDAANGDGAAFRARHGIAVDATVLCVLPGSRKGEVRRLLPLFQEVVERLAKSFPGLVAVVPTVETVVDRVTDAVAHWAVRTVVVDGTAEKFDAFAASTASLAASGTVSLELAVAKVPMVIAYRIWAPTAWVVARIVKVKWATLINILLDREAIPEFIQAACTPEALETEVARLLSDPAARQAQTEAFAEALPQIGLGSEKPSLRAADTILQLVAARQVSMKA